MNKIKILVISIFLIIIINLFNVQIINNKKYIDKLTSLTESKYYGSTAPRGRILDRNGKVIVDNKPVRVIYYKKEQGTSKVEEQNLVKKLSEILDIDTSKITINILKDYYIYINNTSNLISEEEKEMYKNRKMSSNDLYNLKIKRITEEDIKNINVEEAYIYHLMNNGYSYEEKVIKNENVSELEYASIAENIGVLKGVGVKMEWERYYPYGNTLRTILGTVDNIPKEKKEYYLSKGYNLTDKVGISYLEYQYDDYLRGEKNEYIKYNDGTYRLVKEGKRGNDIYLNIDIELQKKVEDIIINNIRYSKNEPNTLYLNKSFVIITDVKTGGILTLAGKQIINNDIYDYSLGTINSTHAVGSVVKAASHIVGYNNNALYIGEIRNDDCIKIKNTPSKCSIRYLGILDDLTAIQKSSNTFQFNTAIKVGKAKYSYNSPLIIDETAFDKYRYTFSQFGLGTYTKIDLPNEKIGLIGTKKDAGLLLDLSIGQYDTYTPIELSQYITTIANDGIKLKPTLLKEVRSDKELLLEVSKEELGKVETNSIYLNRVKTALNIVMQQGGTGYGYIDLAYNPSGKTGTSQTFIDTNNDGKIDTQTVTTSFVGYFPTNNPQYSIAVVTPDVAVSNNNNYISMITKRIVHDVTDTIFSK